MNKIKEGQYEVDREMNREGEWERRIKSQKYRGILSKNKKEEKKEVNKINRNRNCRRRRDQFYFRCFCS